MKTETIISEDLKRQREYTKELLDTGFDFGLVLADAFVKGMRDIGYKNTGTALDELIDNSIQGEARSIHVLLGFDNNPKRPSKLAVIDDGHGMDAAMIRAAVMWGGTHRQNDRTGFGRYGYGLPSSCVSIGTKYTVYSKVEGGQWHKVTIDLLDIENHFKSGNVSHVTVPKAQIAELPAWVSDYNKETYGELTHGTVVVIEQIDRLSYWSTQNLREFFFHHFGVTYRNFLRKIQLFVDGKKVEPIDPLFTTPGYRYYDIDDDRAEALEPLSIEVKGRETKETIGVINVRFSYMPPTFLRKPEFKLRPGSGRKGNNARLEVRRENNGIIVLRSGRQIDVVTNNPFYSVQNNDRYIGVEIDFPPIFDEEFNITTSKQQVVFSERLWDILKDNGVGQAISQLRGRFSKEAKALDVKQDTNDEEKPRASEAAMESAQKFIHRNPLTETPEEKREGEENLEKEIDKISQQTGLSKEIVKQGWEAKNNGRHFKVEYVDYPDAPFYSLERIGGLKVLKINKAHPFYSEFYAAPDSSPTMRFRLEVLLFVLGDCELSATADGFKSFYRTERSEWSKNLRIVLDELSEYNNQEDDAELNAELLDAESVTAEQPSISV